MIVCDKCGKGASEQITIKSTQERIDLCPGCGKIAVDFLKSRPGTVPTETDDQATGDELKRRRGRKKSTEV